MNSRETKYAAYLFVFFIGNAKHEEAIHFALSYDGFNYKALNGNKPVIASEKISSTGGVRDPHIIRGADNESFYMVATDMVSTLGWESNRAMILMKSRDLIHWNSSIVHIQTRFPGETSLLRVWAPQTIYDAQRKQYMIYWSMKHGVEPDKIYFAYANADFTDLETAPQQLYFDPHNHACIDADIVFKDGRFFLFFKTHEEVAGIKIAVSDRLTEGYVLRDQYVQQTKAPVEGSCVFRLNNGNGYLFIYDIYMNGKYQFTHTRDFETFEVIDEKVSMDFHPRHGSVISITQEEVTRLVQMWG